MEAGHSAGAIQSAERAVELDDGNRQAWWILATLSQSVGSHEKAVIAGYKSLAFDPDDQFILVALADSLITLGRLDEAERFIIPAAEKFPDDVQILIKAAATLSKQGRHGEAMPYSRRALDIQPDSTLIQMQHFDILEKHGDHEPAFELIKPMLESDDPPLWAALNFAKLSPVFDTREDARYLLRKFTERTDLIDAEREAIQEALAFMDQKEYSDIYGTITPPG
jgi:tetratricopeptide (TPR) repeat protein